MGTDKYKFRVRTETILYTVIKYCDQKLYGLPDILADRAISDFPSIETSALEDLMENGCAGMDFNGKVSINQDYIECIRRCARCREIAGVDIRRPDGRQNHMTIYLMDTRSDCIVLRNVDGEYAGICGLYHGSLVELMRQINESIDAYENIENMPREYSIESSVVQRGKAEDIEKYGCDRTTADVIAGASRGEQTALVVKKLHADSEAGFYSAIWGNEICMEMKVKYEDWKENIIYTATSKSEIIRNVKKIIET